MHWMKPLLFFELLFAGLLAGFEIAVHYALVKIPETIGAANQILLRQAMTRRLRVLSPGIFFPTLLLALAVTVQEWHAPGLWLQGVGIAGLVLWIAIRIVRTVPINRGSMQWKPEDPPENWRALIRQAEKFHVVASWAAVIAFTCFLASSFW